MIEQSVVDILKRVERIQIIANRKVNDLMAGHYHSVFRGQGMEFDRVREYQPGDDVRSIDWNVTARAGHPFIKQFIEERELTVLFLVDVSASGAFGSLERSKLDMVIEVVAMLMFSALKNNDKVGLGLFADEVHSYFPARKGKANLLRLIRELVSVRPVAKETNVKEALDFINGVHRRRAIVFLLSDFLGQDPAKLKTALAVTNRRHDLITINVNDPREESLPDVGFVTLRDAETGEVMEVDTSHPEVRRLFAEQARERANSFDQLFKRASVDQLPVRTDADYAKGIRRFFEMRERRFR
ncbi:hypothetical protein Pan216_15700 [Planctomycetes bacterium Pan216]|uniref:VWFA domain-containing protein n=1 Tax=Kolteria novifilia TaxID=2527975 RepID=A0A518B166_9BACT|nr:hypothetical protein Pan216_15700 [Planctomycetes bacterium Pan216]